MKKDSIESLFEKHRRALDVYDTPEGHTQRFVERLNQRNAVGKTGRNWWKPLSIAATVVVILGIGFFLLQDGETKTGLAGVSPEMEQTQTFFTAAINSELEKLKSFKTTETAQLVNDALNQITILEQEYQQLKEDLVASGNDQRVIAAMIANFQSRINLLENVIELIEEIKHLKTNENETTI